MRTNKSGPYSSYLVVGPEPANQCVELWSVHRLPFDKLSAELREMRAELASRVRLLECSSDELIHGVYASGVKDTCDAENILFYNVGLGPFAHSSPMGLRFERTFADPPPIPRSLSNIPLHYHRYCPADASGGFRHWRQRRSLARWNLETTTPDMFRSASRTWWLMRSQPENVQIGSGPSLGWFGLRIQIHAHDRYRANAATLIKPLFDGVISAFHAHTGQKIDSIAGILSGRLSVSAEEVKSYLLSSEIAVLGARQLLWPWRDSVQWNPADERCVAGELVLGPREDVGITLSGELFEVVMD
jgi:hypothetical protein